MLLVHFVLVHFLLSLRMRISFFGKMSSLLLSLIRLVLLCLYFCIERLICVSNFFLLLVLPLVLFIPLFLVLLVLDLFSRRQVSMWLAENQLCFS